MSRLSVQALPAVWQPIFLLKRECVYSFWRRKSCPGIRLAEADWYTGPGNRSLLISDQLLKEIFIRQIFTATDITFQREGKSQSFPWSCATGLTIFLVNKAADAGAEINDGNAVMDIRGMDTDRIIVKTDNSTISCRYLIGADGAYSRVAKICGFPDDRFLIPALEYEVWPDLEIFKKLEEEVRFDLGIIPYGYGWVFPKQDHLSIGVGHFRRMKIDLKQYCNLYIQDLGIRDTKKTIRHGFQIPTRPRGLYGKRNIILAGDAAGLADPVVAEGISHALMSGIIAAGSILDS